MHWLILIVSGMLESVWATTLSQLSQGNKLLWSSVFLAACGASMGGLAYALRAIPVGTGYAVWAGCGAITTALVGIIFLSEPVTVARIVCLALIVTGIVGLQLFH